MKTVPLNIYIWFTVEAEDEGLPGFPISPIFFCPLWSISFKGNDHKWAGVPDCNILIEWKKNFKFSHLRPTWSLQTWLLTLMLDKVRTSFEIKAILDKELYWRNGIHEPPQQRWYFKPLHTTHENDEVFYLDLDLDLFVTLNPARLASHYIHTSCDPFLHTTGTHIQHRMSI